MKNLSSIFFTFATFVITHNASSMSMLTKRYKLHTFSTITPRVKTRALSTTLLDDNKVKPRRISPKEVSDWVSYSQILLYGIDSTTLQSIKEIQASLDKIRTGCYCSDTGSSTLSRQTSLSLINNALKRLAAKTTAQNCDTKSEVYK